MSLKNVSSSLITRNNPIRLVVVFFLVILPLVYLISNSSSISNSLSPSVAYQRKGSNRHAIHDSRGHEDDEHEDEGADDEDDNNDNNDQEEATTHSRTKKAPKSAPRAASSSSSSSSSSLASPLRGHARLVSRLFRDLRALQQSNMQVHPLLDGRINGKGMTIIDVGANRGDDYSITGIRNNFKVYSFEPIPDIWGAFLDTFKSEKSRLTVIPVTPGSPAKFPADHATWKNHCYFVQAAASNDTSKVSVRSNGEMSSLTDQSFYQGNHGHPTDIATVVIDEYIDEDIFLFKVDTQGHEYFVLKGAENLLRTRKVRYMTLEYWPEGIRRSGADPVGLLEFIYDLGFECADVATNKYGPNNIYEHVRPDRPSTFEGYVGELSREPVTGKDGFIGLWDELFCWRDV